VDSNEPICTPGRDGVYVGSSFSPVSFGRGGDRIMSLQPRQKWIATRRNLHVDDIVVVKDDNSPRNCWKIARVEETYPDDDGLVRKVRHKIADGNLDDNGGPKGPKTSLYRPVQKLVLLLPCEECEDREIPT